MVNRGVLFHDGIFIGTGYSGKELATNNTNYESLKNIGPLPRGNYIIEAPVQGTEKGPNAIPLTPNPNNKMFGRSGFMIHADSIEHPGFASDGCIVLIPSVREQIIQSTDKEFQVI